MTGTSIKTPTTVARAAPDSKPNRLMAAATASSKKLLAPISADGAATPCASHTCRSSTFSNSTVAPPEASGGGCVCDQPGSNPKDRIIGATLGLRKNSRRLFAASGSPDLVLTPATKEL